MSSLVEAIQALADAREMPEVYATVASAARKIAQADGAAFVLRDGKQCFYAAEDTVEPLWAGEMFPIDRCISGWSMIYRQSVSISDVSQDERTHAGGYDKTFVKGLTMVPIRVSSPVGAIGCYWSGTRTPTNAELAALQSLAEATAVTMDSVEITSLALTDSLSGQLNRRGYFTEGPRRLAENRQRGNGTTVVMAQMTGVDELRHRLGDDAADESIRAAGAALRRACGDSAVVARITDDCFAACASTDDVGILHANELEQVLKALVPDGVTAPELITGITTDDGTGDLDDMIGRANTAKYTREHGHPPPPGMQMSRSGGR